MPWCPYVVSKKATSSPGSAPPIFSGKSPGDEVAKRQIDRDVIVYFFAHKHRR